MSNIDTVKAIYAAFGRQDVPAILEHVSDDVDWDFGYGGDTDPGVPWLARRRGREGVAQFFASVGASLEFERFEISTIVGDGATVIALAKLAAKVRSTGKRVAEDEEAHVWHFDARGRVSRFRHCADTLQHHRAAQA